MKYFSFCKFLLLSILIYSCAIQVPPDGGMKDILPPHFISADPPNYSSSFTGHDIQLDFDEIIALNDLNAQLIVSPLLNNHPETKIRKKTLFIHLSDTLLENTTYTMNFGQGIADVHEGNKLDNFQYVFSTGPVIDSLYIKGRVKNSFDNKTEKGILVLLYRGTEDSLPYLKRPVYFSRTNDSGFYQIKNISPGTYKMIGLKEKDGDYLYSQGEEYIGFPDSLVEANSENVNMRIFKEIPSLRFLRAYSEFPGKAVLVFNTAADTMKWNWLTDTTKLEIYSENFSPNSDTLNIWYKNYLADSLSFYFNYDSLKDTVTLRLFKKTDATMGKRPFLLSVTPDVIQTTVQHLHLPFYLECNHPLSITDFDKIILLEDSLPVKPKFVFTDSIKMHLNLEYHWKSKSKYSIYIPPASFTDIYGLLNDTVQLSFNSHSESDYGSVKLHLIKTDDSPYVLQLVDADDANVYRELKANHDTIVEFNNLEPRVYQVKLIRDVNGNGKWDTGNYLKHIQPEEIEFNPEGITIRANWDVDVFVKAPLTPVGIR